MSDKKELKKVLKAQQFALDAAYTYENLLVFFEKDNTYRDPLMKISEQKEKLANVLEGISGKQLEAKHGDFRFLKIWRRIFGNSSMFKNMAGSETEQGDLLRNLAKTYPNLKPYAQENYIQASTLRRLQDRSKKRKKSRKKR